MPVQQQMASFAGKLGTKVTEANAEHAGKPVDLAGKRLPSNIRNGVARLSTMYTKKQDKDGGICPKGEIFFRASAIVVSPPEYAGAVTSFTVPLCDMPAKNDKPMVPFSENWNKFRSLFEALGVAKFPEAPIDAKRDPAGALAQGQRIEAYFFGAMRTLTDATRMKTNPIFISFSTRGWTPPKTALKPNPTEMVFEDWHGLAKDYHPRNNPAAGMQDNLPPTDHVPPSANGSGHAPEAQQFDDGASAESPYHDGSAEGGVTDDPAELIAALVDIAMNDPEGATPEGVDASGKLEQMAWDNGWTTEQTDKAKDWSEVGSMALSPPEPAAAAPVPPTSSVQKTSMTGMENTGPAVGSKWLFAKRGQTGAKLKNGQGIEFPPQEVEVSAIDATSKTCTVKSKDGREVVDLRSKKPVAVKFEWLEPLV